MNDLVSVIIPVYKVEPYLRECLDSVVNQTYSNLEIILVDDGSPDGCPKICDEYAERDSRVKVIHKENGGISDARNKGLDIATGEYVIFVDSDDVIHEKYVEYLYNALIESNADTSVCQMANFTEIENVKGKKIEQESYELSGKEAVVDLYKRLCGIKCSSNIGVMVTACGKMFEKKMFEKIRFPKGKIHEDDAAIPILLYQSKVVSVMSAQLYFRRLTENSITRSTFSIKRYDCVEVTELCASFFEQQKEKEIYELALLRKRMLLCGYALLAKQVKLYEQLPAKYKINRWKNFLFIKKYLHCSWKEILAFLFPKLYGVYCCLRRS